MIYIFSNIASFIFTFTSGLATIKVLCLLDSLDRNRNYILKKYRLLNHYCMRRINQRVGIY